jgi:hypothetical protein
VPLTPKLVRVLTEWKLACPKGVAGLVVPNTDGKICTNWSPKISRVSATDVFRNETKLFVSKIVDSDNPK